MQPAPSTLEQFIEQVDEIAHAISRDTYMKLVGVEAPAISPSYYARRLQGIFESINKSMPPCTTTMPSGKQWHGTKLPQGWAQAQVLMPDRSSDIPEKRASLLHLASVVRLRPKWVGWLLASGVDPLKYCPETANAPLGQMAYSGDHACVRVLRRAGFDLTLPLPPEHLDMNDPGQARLAGTTLLHRLVSRIRFPESDTRQVVDELLRAGLSPTQASLSGETPLDLCRDPQMRQHLERHVAKKSRQSLQASTEPARASVPRNAPRF